MKLQTLRDLYIHELKDLYSAEQQLVKALPKVAQAATHPELKAGLEAHLEETVEHVTRLETILSGLGESTRGPKCKGMEGLLVEASHLIEEKPDPEVLDAGIIGGAQKAEHYEIASYGTARTYAELLGEEEAAVMLQTTLDEEYATDQKLTALALASVNLEAADNETAGEARSGKQGNARAGSAKAGQPASGSKKRAA